MSSSLAPLWEAVLPSHAPPTSPLETAESITQIFSTSPPPIGHTAALAVLWVTWKARNKMVFYAHRLSPRDIARQLCEHVKLWICRAPSRLDVEPLQAYSLFLPPHVLLSPSTNPLVEF
ncbi:hypothetical protein SETIT_9G222700v2 [Setaria italica]|uniref:Uncharacterized protein n=1 Tax=Setaria italica TaxID=4555 RepID=K4AGT0_SETIT|nr:hypothetical protein SETIT_9G222700v2 [Setaria italica]